MNNSKKITSLILAGMLAVTALSGCSSKDNESSTAGTESKSPAKGTAITMMNTKSEIQPQLEAAAKEYEKLKGVSLEVYAVNGGTPAEAIAQKYAAGDPPTMAMLDPIDILEIAGEKAIPLNDEKWVADGGDTMGMKIGDTLYSFPFCVEGRGLVYNKTAIEDTLGKDFDPKTIKSGDDLKAVFDELVAAGMEYPMVINKEDWSLGAHFLCLLYEEQDGTELKAYELTDGMKAGTVNLMENARFNSLFDTFDLLKDYNINKKDPMAADYDLNASYVAEGESAFWFNGNWAWAEISEYASDDTEFGIMPVVQNTSADDFANNQITAGGSKQVMIDKVKATAEQQAAAKEFLNWLVYDQAGQDVLVNKCNLVPAFKNITLEVTNPLGISIKDYVDAGEVFEPYNGSPGDHWATLGASMQKYLAGQIDRQGLASEIEAYWAKQK